MPASRETMEPHRLVGGLDILPSCQLNKKTITPSALAWYIPSRKMELGLLLPVTSTHISLFFSPSSSRFFVSIFHSSSANHPQSFFHITRLSLWNNRGRPITFPRVAVFSFFFFFCQGEENGMGHDKRTSTSVKGRPLWSDCCCFWPYWEEYLISLLWIPPFCEEKRIQKYKTTWAHYTIFTFL